MQPFTFSQAGVWDGSLAGFRSAAARAQSIQRYEVALAEATTMWRQWQEGGIDPLLMRAALSPGTASDFTREYLGRHY